MEEMGMHRPFFVLVILSLAAPLKGADDLEENEATLAGGIVEADDLWLSGMNLCVRKDRPATMMGMVRYANQPRSFTYVFVIKGDEARNSTPRWKSEQSVVGSIAREVGSLELGDKRVEFTYAVEVDPKRKAQPKETLVINNLRTDPKGGRVFLIDLTGKRVTWQQLDVRLPAPPPVPANLADVSALSGQVIKDLKSDSATVREFLRKD
jgi:hypothetical protein